MNISCSITNLTENNLTKPNLTNAGEIVIYI